MAGVGGPSCLNYLHGQSPPRRPRRPAAYLVGDPLDRRRSPCLATRDVVDCRALIGERDLARLLATPDARLKPLAPAVHLRALAAKRPDERESLLGLAASLGPEPERKRSELAAAWLALAEPDLGTLLSLASLDGKTTPEKTAFIEKSFRYVAHAHRLDPRLQPRLYEATCEQVYMWTRNQSDRAQVLSANVAMAAKRGSNSSANVR